MKDKGRQRRGLQKNLQVKSKPANIRELCASVLPYGWNNLSNNSSDETQLRKVSSQSGTSSEAISHSIIINSNMAWNVYVHGNKVSCRKNTPLS